MERGKCQWHREESPVTPPVPAPTPRPSTPRQPSAQKRRPTGCFPSWPRHPQRLRTSRPCRRRNGNRLRTLARLWSRLSPTCGPECLTRTSDEASKGMPDSLLTTFGQQFGLVITPVPNTPGVEWRRNHQVSRQRMSASRYRASNRPSSGAAVSNAPVLQTVDGFPDSALKQVRSANPVQFQRGIEAPPANVPRSRTRANTAIGLGQAGQSRFTTRRRQTSLPCHRPRS